MEDSVCYRWTALLHLTARCFWRRTPFVVTRMVKISACRGKKNVTMNHGRVSLLHELQRPAALIYAPARSGAPQERFGTSNSEQARPSTQKAKRPGPPSSLQLVLLSSERSGSCVCCGCKTPSGSVGSKSTCHAVPPRRSYSFGATMSQPRSRPPKNNSGNPG